MTTKCKRETFTESSARRQVGKQQLTTFKYYQLVSEWILLLTRAH